MAPLGAQIIPGWVHMERELSPCRAKPTWFHDSLWHRLNWSQKLLSYLFARSVWSDGLTRAGQLLGFKPCNLSEHMNAHTHACTLPSEQHLFYTAAEVHDESICSTITILTAGLLVRICVMAWKITFFSLFGCTCSFGNWIIYHAKIISGYLVQTEVHF